MGKRVVMIGVENGYPIGQDIANVRKFYDLGARYITLSHSGHNQICDSSSDPTPLHNGLSDFGRKVVAEMNRLGVQRVFLLGGTKTLTAQVVNDIHTKVSPTVEVVRIEGRDRTATAAEIALKARQENGAVLSKMAFVCNGWKFADALAASPVAASGNAPILLTHAASLDASVSTAIDALGITDVVILGQTSSVDTPVENALGASPMRAQSAAETNRLLLAIALLGSVAMVCIAALLWDGNDRGLLALGAAAASAFIAQALVKNGTLPPGRDPAHHRVRSASVILPPDVAFKEAAKEALLAREGVGQTVAMQVTR
jgi:hypothetical protein